MSESWSKIKGSLVGIDPDPGLAGDGGSALAMSINEAQITAVARLLGALGEPSRIRILRALWDGPATVNEIAQSAGLKQSNASKQLALLVDVGVLGRRREGVMVYYEITLPMVRELCLLVCDGARLITQARYEPFAERSQERSADEPTA
jgi:ArsR family transcriptional regulator